MGKKSVGQPTAFNKKRKIMPRSVNAVAKRARRKKSP